MKKAQITSMITLLLLSIGIIANATMASEDLDGIREAEIIVELNSSIAETEVASLPGMGNEVASVEIYNENLELIASGTAQESRIIKLVLQCDLITTITGKQFFRLAYEHE